MVCVIDHVLSFIFNIYIIVRFIYGFVLNRLVYLITVFCFFLQSCCTLTQTGHQVIPITSNPQGAYITLDGRPMGTTPLYCSLDQKRSHEIVLEKEGYVSRAYVLDSQVSPKKLSSNTLFIPGLGLAFGGTLGCLFVFSGQAAWAPLAILIGGVYGAMVGVIPATVGTGVDLASGKSKHIYPTYLHVELERTCETGSKIEP